MSGADGGGGATVVTRTGNIHFISAGAGSGKTYSLTRKLEELLVSGEVTPAGVIATTFTRLAAGELKERVRGKLVEAGQLRVANQMEQALIGTVNGVCGELLGRFAFEAGMPPEQRVLEEEQGTALFYQAMERALEGRPRLIKEMNAVSARLELHDRTGHLTWRAEVRDIVSAARANNMEPDSIRGLGITSADELLTYFPDASRLALDDLLLGEINTAIAGIDPETDTTKTTRDYVSLIRGIRAGLVNRRVTWPEWIKLTKQAPAKTSRALAEPIADVASNYPKHPGLHRDLRFFAEQVFEIAADSMNAFQALKQRKGLIDFVDQEQRLYHLLDDPSVAATLGEELELLMVDEFQDTSPIQLALFLKLSALASQVIWVGDIKQSIYGFRGADPVLMQAVVKQVTEIGNPPEILTHSWRSTSALVHYVNALFVPAFANSMRAEQVRLAPARGERADEPAVITWRLKGRNKDLRARALADAVRQLFAGGRTVIDKASREPRPLNYGDVAILCRTHSNLASAAAALGALSIPIRYQRAGLLATPEGCLALACLRRLIDPQDTLASAEIVALTTCDEPETWITDRLAHLAKQPQSRARWLEDRSDGPVATLMAQRSRLPHLTPVETLRVAIEAGGVREAVYRWGPTEQRSQHRLNNLSALLEHANTYMEQCAATREPASAAGLVLWLRSRAADERDTQASGGDEAAVQLVTHHGAKGLEWPIVIAMDLDASLRPRLWGLTVAAPEEELDLFDPLAGRRLRYWPSFVGAQSSGIDLLDQINDSDAGNRAMKAEIEEAKRLLYVSLTRARDGLIITMSGNKDGGPWMDVLGADWMLPTGDRLRLPDGSDIPSACDDFDAEHELAAMPEVFTPQWLDAGRRGVERKPLRVNASAVPPEPEAAVGEVIELGDRLPISGEFEPAELGLALHAVIASRLMGQNATARILADYGLDGTITEEAAALAAERLLDAVANRFAPSTWYPEYPVRYRNRDGQSIGGWIDLLLETPHGWVLIDHKASPLARTAWESTALGYSGQLRAYADGVKAARGRRPARQFIHFAVTGGLVEVLLP